MKYKTGLQRNNFVKYINGVKVMQIFSKITIKIYTSHSYQ
jgi:hypothetical protein